MRLLITGATGFIGSSLVERVGGAVVLGRDPARAQARFPAVAAHGWLPESGPPPSAALQGVEAVIHLAGEPVAEGRWTSERKRRIRDSRVIGTRNLVAGLAAQAERPRVLVAASAVGFYGDRGDLELEETASCGAGFLAEVCAAWEQEAQAAEALGIRVVCVRNGIVLSRRGGALVRMLPPFRLGLGGPLGHGRQWMPWIHLDDVIGLLLHAAATETIRGPLNAAGPRPVTNTEFTRALGAALGRPTLLRVPAAALRLAFGELSQLLLASQRVIPRVAVQTGYQFRHPELVGALAELG